MSENGTASKKDEQAELRFSYKRTFGDADGKKVLVDLARFCHIGFAHGLNSDAQMVYGVECMRKVFWHIHDMVYRDAAVKEPRQATNYTPPVSFENGSPYREIL